MVDDEEIIVETLKPILQDEGYAVETATTGQEALKKFDKARFGLVILDIKLPDITGDEVAKLMKKQNGDTKIVLITGYSFFQDCIDALDLGINEILLKPISPEEILRTTKEAFSH